MNFWKKRAKIWRICGIYRRNFPRLPRLPAVAAAGVAMASAAGEVFVAVLNGVAGGMSRGLLGGLFRQDDFHAAPKGFADGLGGMI